jgi:thiol-disulfide isomerase/thioredoxin
MKRWIKYSLWTILVIVVIATGYIFIQTSYNGNDKIILLNSGQAYTSFQDIINLPEFKNKIVYVDVWGTSCPPCFEELKNYTPQLTKRYKDKKDIVFLYICIDRHPLPEVRWKEKIQTLKPSGYHVLVEAAEEHKLAKDIVGQAVKGQFFPYEPCYFIVNKQGQIVDRPTTDPGEMELKPSDTTKLYSKLDSLRQL